MRFTAWCHFLKTRVQQKVCSVCIQCVYYTHVYNMKSPEAAIYSVLDAHVWPVNRTESWYVLATCPRYDILRSIYQDRMHTRLQRCAPPWRKVNAKRFARSSEVTSIHSFLFLLGALLNCGQFYSCAHDGIQEVLNLKEPHQAQHTTRFSVKERLSHT